MFIPLEPRSNIVHLQKVRYPRIQLVEYFQIRDVLKKYIKVDKKGRTLFWNERRLELQTY